MNKANSSGMMTIHCPICGYRFGKSGSGTNSETECPKCKSKLAYTVSEDKLSVRIIKWSDKKPA